MSLYFSHAAAPPVGCRLVAVDGRTIPLRDVHVQADAGGGLARVVLQQRFDNDLSDPLAATYQLPLPADGAVVGFSFQIGDQRIVGEIDGKERARQRYEEALAQGRSAAILEQDRSSLFTQELGNIPPGVSITAEITIEQPLAWRQDGWEWRFPTVVAPRFVGAGTTDAERVSVDVADGPMAATVRLTMAIRDALTGPACSPSHTLSGDAQALTLPVGSPLDRDLVVRWPVSTPEPTTRLALGMHGDDLYGLLTIVPPLADSNRRVVPRDLIVLLDTSGSMGGRPLSQAKALCRALIDGMSEQDLLEIISFASRPERWRPQPVLMDATGRAEARQWLEGLKARGGTQMRDGIIAALQPMRRDAQRQVVLISDGLISFEQQVIAEVLGNRPDSSRVHAVGVGSIVNRSLTASVARAGGGVEVIIGLDDSADAAAEILGARTAHPEVVDLSLSGSALVQCAPRAMPDLFAGAPARLSLQLRPGELVLSGRTADGPWRQVLTVDAQDADRPVIATRFAREAAADLELAVAAGGAKKLLDAQIEALGLAHGIATRLTSWVAATAAATVDPADPTRRVRIPQALAYGMSAEGVGLRRHRDQGIARSVRATTSHNLYAKPAPAPAPSEPDSSVRIYFCRPGNNHIQMGAEVRLHLDRRLILEVSIEVALSWNPVEIIAFTDVGYGNSRPAKLVGGTSPGCFDQGLLLRLIIELPDDARPMYLLVMMKDDPNVELWLPRP